MTEFVVPDSVHSAHEDNGLLIVLNVRTGQWHALNSTGSVIFDWLRRTGDLESAIRDLVDRFPEAPEARLREDAHRLVGMLVGRGLVETGKGKGRHPGSTLMALPSRQGVKLPLLDVLTAVLCLAGALLLLRFPLRVPVSLVEKAKGRVAVEPASVQQAVAALDAARAASRFFPCRVACMESSLTAVLFGLAKRRSLDWCFGFSSEPVSFHAWVRAEGQAVVHDADDPIDDRFRTVLAV
ncbi:lasso peptide biosynthesis B2 protein [Actinosynnema sp. NPDC059797]